MDDTDWSLIDFGDKPKKGAAQVAPFPLKRTCPNCGRELGRGGHFHVKNCKGSRE